MPTSSGSIQPPPKIVAEHRIKTQDLPQQGAFTNAVAIIAKEGFDDDMGITHDYHEFKHAPLDQGLSMLYAPKSGQNSRTQRTEIMGQAYREAVSRSAKKTHHHAISQDLLEQIQDSHATYRSQEIMLELVALSLAAAGYNLHQSATNHRQFTLNDTFPSNSAIGIPSGYNGTKKGLKFWRSSDSTPRKVAQHTNFLNEFKKAGRPTLSPSPFVALSNSIMRAEQLFNHGKMLLICTPTETLREHPSTVKQLLVSISKLDQEAKENGGEVHEDTLQKTQTAVEVARKIFLN